MRCLVVLTGLLLMALSSGVQADTVWMRNGDRINGTIRSLSDGKLVMDTTYAGTLSINWTEVSTLASNNAIELRNSTTKEAYRVRLIASDPGYIDVQRDDAIETVSVSRVDEFMKAKVRSDQLNWGGNVDVNIKLLKASTRTKDYNFALNNKITQGRWRHDFGSTFNREKENDSINTDNYSLRYALDYRFREQYFWQGRLNWRRDWVEDLSHQAVIGTGPGYQFWDNELGSFSLSLLAGVFEYGYSDGSRDRNFGGTLHWDYERYLRGKTLTLFSHGDVTHSIDEDGIFTLNGEVGLRFALTSWSTLNVGYGHNLVSGTRDTLNERRFTTGLGVKW